jgi:hypothetical protein
MICVIIKERTCQITPQKNQPRKKNKTRVGPSGREIKRPGDLCIPISQPRYGLAWMDAIENVSVGPATDDYDWPPEEYAWLLITRNGWPATPELLFALKQFVIETALQEQGNNK